MFEQGIKPAKDLSAQVLGNLSFLHNRQMDELDYVARLLEEVKLQTLSLDEMFDLINNFKKVKAFQMQCCYLKGVNSWTQFCKDYMNTEPEIAKHTVMPLVASLEPLAKSKHENNKCPGWWVKERAQEEVPIPTVKNFLLQCDAARSMRLAGASSDEVIFFVIKV